MQSAALLDAQSSAGDVFILDMGQPVRIVDLAVRFIEAHGLYPKLPDAAAVSEATGQMRIVFTGARPGEKRHEQLARDPHALVPTAHPDILTTRLPEVAEQLIEQILAELSPQRRSRDRDGVAAAIRRLMAAELQSAAA